MEQDIRWQQRFSNYRKALDRFRNNVSYIQSLYGDIDLQDLHTYDDIAFGVEDILKQGLIQSFEFTHELAWKIMKDFAEYQGNTQITGSRDAIRYAASVNLITNAHVWMDMIVSRNKTLHTYNEETANEIFRNIITQYSPLFDTFNLTLEKLRSGGTGDLF